MKKKKICLVIGTRPEAIKIAPLYHLLKKTAEFDTFLCATGQHKEMLDQALKIFKMEPDCNLQVMKANQNLSNLFSEILVGVKKYLEIWEPDLLIVHGDTCSTLAASLAAYFNKTKIAHVEAGLRTNNLYSPWPEEGNRKITGAIADINFCPTKIAETSLLAEGVLKKNIYVTGNTIVDSVELAINLSKENELQHIQYLSSLGCDFTKKIILVTTHRRENFGCGFEDICNAILTIANNHDVQIIFPVHLNPNVQKPVNKILKNNKNILLIKPLEYLDFTYLLSKCYFVLTDSGGIQEEAPSFKKPVLILRDFTERPEAVNSGSAKIVGSSYINIVNTANELLNNQDIYDSMITSENPYGDGNASKRIVEILRTIII